MKKTRSLIFLIMILSVIVLVFSACGKKRGQESHTDPTKAATEPTGADDNSTTSATENETNTPTSGASGNPIFQKSCQEIIEYIYANMEQTSFFEARQPQLVFTDVKKDNCKWYLGVSDVPYEEAVASEADQPSDYSFVVAKITKGKDIEAIKQTVKNAVRPDKWGEIGGEVAFVETNENVLIVVIADEDTANIIRTKFLFPDN